MEVRSLVGGVAAVCEPRLALAAAARVMVEDQVGSLGVVEGDRLVGIITDRDVVRAVAAGEAGEARVSEWMTPNPDSLAPDVEVEEAIRWLLATGYRHLPVVEEGQLLGMVSIKDLLWAVTSPRRREGRT